MRRDTEAVATVVLWVALLLGLALVLMEEERKSDELRAALSSCEERQVYGASPYSPLAVPGVGR